MSFIAKEEKRSAINTEHDVHDVTMSMVSAALQADVGGGQKAAIYQSYHPQIVRAARQTLTASEVARVPEDILQTLQGKADDRIYNGMASASSRFQSELYKMAYLLYMEARDPKTDITHALKMQKNAIYNAVESWGHYADMDKVFLEHQDYRSSPDRIPNALKAVEAAMRQSLKEQRIGPDVRIGICG